MSATGKGAPKGGGIKRSYQDAIGRAPSRNDGENGEAAKPSGSLLRPRGSAGPASPRPGAPRPTKPIPARSVPAESEPSRSGIVRPAQAPIRPATQIVKPGSSRPGSPGPEKNAAAGVRPRFGSVAAAPPGPRPASAEPAALRPRYSDAEPWRQGATPASADASVTRPRTSTQEQAKQLARPEIVRPGGARPRLPAPGLARPTKPGLVQPAISRPASATSGPEPMKSVPKGGSVSAVGAASSSNVPTPEMTTSKSAPPKPTSREVIPPATRDGVPKGGDGSASSNHVPGPKVGLVRGSVATTSTISVPTPKFGSAKAVMGGDATSSQPSPVKPSSRQVIRPVMKSASRASLISVKTEETEDEKSDSVKSVLPESQPKMGLLRPKLKSGSSSPQADEVAASNLKRGAPPLPRAGANGAPAQAVKRLKTVHGSMAGSIGEAKAQAPGLVHAQGKGKGPPSLVQAQGKGKVVLPPKTAGVIPLAKAKAAGVSPLAKAKMKAASGAGLLAPKAQVSAEKTKEWTERCSLRFTQNGKSGKTCEIAVKMEAADLGDVGLVQFCTWLDKRLKSMCQGDCTIVASEINLSNNGLGHQGVQSLCSFLEAHYVTIEVLKLSGNNLHDRSLQFIARYMTSYCSTAMHELHLSNNKITAQGVLYLLSCLAMHPLYPRWNADSKQYVPLWVPVGGNTIPEEEVFALLGSCEEFDMSLCLVRPGCTVNSCCDSHVARGQKHNCVAHLADFIEDAEATTPLPISPHVKPIFAASQVGQQVHAKKINRESPVIIYEDKDIAVFLKPAGWVCSMEHIEPNLEKLPEKLHKGKVMEWMTNGRQVAIHSWLIMTFGSKPENPVCRSKAEQFGLIHRLDVYTSGPLLLGKTPAGYKFAKNQMHDHCVLKDYICLVHGHLAQDQGEILFPIDSSGYKAWTSDTVWCGPTGDPSISKFEALAKYEHPVTKAKFTLVHLRIVTGRTHQIRVHMRTLGHSLVSDTMYSTDVNFNVSDKKLCPRIFLHKFRIGFFDMQSKVVVRWCQLQMANDLWQCLGKLKCVGGQLAAQGCEAMGLVGIHDVGAEGNDEEDDGVAPDYDLRESVADDEQLDGKGQVLTEQEEVCSPEDEPEEGAEDLGEDAENLVQEEDAEEMDALEDPGDPDVGADAADEELDPEVCDLEEDDGAANDDTIIAGEIGGSIWGLIC